MVIETANKSGEKKTRPPDCLAYAVIGFFFSAVANRRQPVKSMGRGGEGGARGETGMTVTAVFLTKTVDRIVPQVR